jgi:hypothetical protein
MLLAHARQAAATGDLGANVPAARTASPLDTLRSLNDLADPALRRHLLRLSRAARMWYEQRLAQAVAAGDLRADADVQTLAGSRESPVPHATRIEVR